MLFKKLLIFCGLVSASLRITANIVGAFIAVSNFQYSAYLGDRLSSNDMKQREQGKEAIKTLFWLNLIGIPAQAAYSMTGSYLPRFLPLLVKKPTYPKALVYAMTTQIAAAAVIGGAISINKNINKKIDDIVDTLTK